MGGLSEDGVCWSLMRELSVEKKEIAGEKTQDEKQQTGGIRAPSQGFVMGTVREQGSPGAGGGLTSLGSKRKGSEPRDRSKEPWLGLEEAQGTEQETRTQGNR